MPSGRVEGDMLPGGAFKTRPHEVVHGQRGPYARVDKRADVVVVGHVVVLRMERGSPIETLDENVRADSEAYEKVKRDNPPDALVGGLPIRFAGERSSVAQGNNKPDREEDDQGWGENIGP